MGNCRMTFIGGHTVDTCFMHAPGLCETEERMVASFGHICCVASCADSCGAVARTIVCMERSYVTAAFFRHRTYERYRALQQQQQAARLLGEGAPTLHTATKGQEIPTRVCQD